MLKVVSPNYKLRIYLRHILQTVNLTNLIYLQVFHTTIVCKNVLEINYTLIHYDFPPPPYSNVDFSYPINFCNIKNVIFNIDMGEGGRTVHLWM